MPPWMSDIAHNVVKNMFQPLLLFFYMGFLVPIMKVGFEFPHVVYQGLVIYLLVSIGWSGGEELAELYMHNQELLVKALGFMAVGFVTNFIIGIVAYGILRLATKLRRIDAATVAAYYGSDSAGTFATCVGALATMQVAAMSTILVAANINPSQLDLKDLDLGKIQAGLEDESTKARWAQRGVDVAKVDEAAAAGNQFKEAPFMPVMLAIMEIPGCLVGLYLVAKLRRTGMDKLGNMKDEPGYDPTAAAIVSETSGHGHGQSNISVEGRPEGEKSTALFSAEMMHEVFLNPGIYLLFSGIVIGFIGQLQGQSVVDKDNPVFKTLFHGFLCLYLLEMGITASRRFGDLKLAGWRFILFGILAPNLFATFGMVVAHLYGQVVHESFTIGTYTVFAVLCGAASYIAVPAIQRLAIPEASPTLPLAASLGLTFSYNVTIGIPVYSKIAAALHEYWPIAQSVTEHVASH